MEIITLQHVLINSWFKDTHKENSTQETTREMQKILLGSTITTNNYLR